MKYPEHEKLKAVMDKRDTIQDFLDFLLDDNGFELGKRHEHTAEEGEEGFLPWEEGGCWKGPTRHPSCGIRTSELFPIHQGSNDRAKLIGQFLGIDSQKLEAEKREMLEELRRANA